VTNRLKEMILLLHSLQPGEEKVRYLKGAIRGKESLAGSVVIRQVEMASY